MKPVMVHDSDERFDFVVVVGGGGGGGGGGGVLSNLKNLYVVVASSHTYTRYQFSLCFQVRGRC